MNIKMYVKKINVKIYVTRNRRLNLCNEISVNFRNQCSTGVMSKSRGYI